MLRHGGNSGDGPLLLSSKLYFAITLVVASPLKMKTILERMHLSLAVVRLWWYSYIFSLKPILWFWAITGWFLWLGLAKLG